MSRAVELGLGLQEVGNSPDTPFYIPPHRKTRPFDNVHPPSTHGTCSLGYYPQSLHKRVFLDQYSHSDLCRVQYRSRPFCPSIYSTCHLGNQHHLHIRDTSCHERMTYLPRILDLCHGNTHCCLRRSVSNTGLHMSHSFCSIDLEDNDNHSCIDDRQNLLLVFHHFHILEFSLDSHRQPNNILDLSSERFGSTEAHLQTLLLRGKKEEKRVRSQCRVPSSYFLAFVLIEE